MSTPDKNIQTSYTSFVRDESPFNDITNSNVLASPMVAQDHSAVVWSGINEADEDVNELADYRGQNTADVVPSLACWREVVASTPQVAAESPQLFSSIEVDQIGSLSKLPVLKLDRDECIGDTHMFNYPPDDDDKYAFLLLGSDTFYSIPNAHEIICNPVLMELFVEAPLLPGLNMTVDEGPQYVAAGQWVVTRKEPDMSNWDWEIPAERRDAYYQKLGDIREREVGDRPQPYEMQDYLEAHLFLFEFTRLNSSDFDDLSEVSDCGEPDVVEAFCLDSAPDSMDNSYFEALEDMDLTTLGSGSSPGSNHADVIPPVDNSPELFVDTVCDSVRSYDSSVNHSDGLDGPYSSQQIGLEAQARVEDNVTSISSAPNGASSFEVSDKDGVKDETPNNGGSLLYLSSGEEDNFDGDDEQGQGIQDDVSIYSQDSAPR